MLHITFSLTTYIYHKQARVVNPLVKVAPSAKSTEGVLWTQNAHNVHVYVALVAAYMADTFGSVVKRAENDWGVRGIRCSCYSCGTCLQIRGSACGMDAQIGFVTGYHASTVVHLKPASKPSLPYAASGCAAVAVE